jgi:YjbE family integral membrane protein
MSQLILDGSPVVAVLQIIVIDVLLGGDNAVVIALACRRLPPKLRNKGIAWGAVGAVALRVLMVFFALQLLELPYLKIVGALLLLWIGIKLLRAEDDDGGEITQSAHLLGAIRTIIVADAVMSLDNVVAVAAAAKGHIGLVAFGIAVSVPIIVWGSRAVLWLMERLTVVIVLGAAMLGWIAGDMLIRDEALQPYVADWPDWAHYAVAAAGAVLVWLVGSVVPKVQGVSRRA